MKAVDKLAITHLTDASAVFRVQTFRMRHGVEHKPSQASAVSLAQLYLAELETLALAEPEKDTKRQRVATVQGEGAPSGSGEGDKSKGKGKDKGKRTKNNADATELCRQFTTDVGCPRGSTCKYKHYSAAGMAGRCFNCGGKHLKSECGSPGGGAAKVAEVSTPGAKRGARRAQTEKPEAEVSSEGQTEAPSSAPTVGPSAIQAIKEAATSLRQELLKAVRMAGTTEQQGSQIGQNPCKGLIDGGATSSQRSG